MKTVTDQVWTAPDAWSGEDPRQMLALAMLSYRGFNDVLPGGLGLTALRHSIREDLEDLDSFAGEWKIVWGPSAYAAPFTLFDDTFLFVVRHRTEPHRHAIVIRGTNPISLADWVLGDFWTGATTPWAKHDDRFPNAAISLSTALGLSTLLHLKYARGPGAASWRLIDERLGDPVREVTRAMLNPLASLGAALRGTGLRASVAQVRAALEKGVAVPPFKQAKRYLTRWRRSPELQIRSLVARANLELLDAMEGTLHLRTSLATGRTIESFLAAAERRHGSELAVTIVGHSKGGALATAMALWLEQSRLQPDGWGSPSMPGVQCVSFAGPTAGNADFAGLVDDMLDTRCLRVVNPLDIVPHAWQTETPDFAMSQIPTLYPDEVFPPLLKSLTAEVIEHVADLEYRHPGRMVAELDVAPLEGDHSLLQHLAAHHVARYAEALGLPAELIEVALLDVD